MKKEFLFLVVVVVFSLLITNSLFKEEKPSMLSINNRTLPPTLNLVSPISEAEGLDLIPLNSIDHQVDYVLSNSFGFGGTNASLIFKSI